jgi:hypothetical protein
LLGASSLIGELEVEICQCEREEIDDEIDILATDDQRR